MAVKVTTWVWDKAKELSGTDLLFMLALADKCNDEEGACFPGVNRLQEMCRLETSRAVQKISARLQEQGYIGVALFKGIRTKHGNTNKYFINGYRASIGLSPIYSGKHPESTDKAFRERMIFNPQGVNGRAPNEGVSVGTPQDMSVRTPQGVNGRTPKSSVEPSVEPSVVSEKEKTLLSMVAVVKKSLKQHGHSESIAKALLGLFTGKQLEKNIDGAPYTPLEIEAFRKWWDDNHKDKKTGKPLTCPKNQDSLKDWLPQWAEETKRQTYSVNPMVRIVREDEADASERAEMEIYNALERARMERQS